MATRHQCEINIVFNRSVLGTLNYARTPTGTLLTSSRRSQVVSIDGLKPWMWYACPGWRLGDWKELHFFLPSDDQCVQKAKYVGQPIVESLATVMKRKALAMSTLRANLRACSNPFSVIYTIRVLFLLICVHKDVQLHKPRAPLPPNVHRREEGETI